MDLASVETPVGVVDLDRARENIERAIAYCRTHGIAWRPHVKTHKSLEMAWLQLKLGATGLTVATAHEAYVMSQATGDLLLAHPPASPAKVDRLCALPRSVDLKVGLDSIEVLRLLARGAAAAERTFGIVVEFDTGLGGRGSRTLPRPCGWPRRPCRCPASASTGSCSTRATSASRAAGRPGGSNGSRSVSRRLWRRSPTPDSRPGGFRWIDAHVVGLSPASRRNRSPFRHMHIQRP